MIIHIRLGGTVHLLFENQYIIRLLFSSLRDEDFLVTGTEMGVCLSNGRDSILHTSYEGFWLKDNTALVTFQEWSLKL